MRQKIFEKAIISTSANTSHTFTMGKKRKTPAGGAAPEKRNGFDAKSKMRAYTSYEDLADSEDEFHINRDKVMLEDGPDVKRRKKWQAEGESD